LGSTSVKAAYKTLVKLSSENESGKKLKRKTILSNLIINSIENGQNNKETNKQFLTAACCPTHTNTLPTPTTTFIPEKQQQTFVLHTQKNSASFVLRTQKSAPKSRPKKGGKKGGKKVYS